MATFNITEQGARLNVEVSELSPAELKTVERVFNHAFEQNGPNTKPDEFIPSGKRIQPNVAKDSALIFTAKFSTGDDASHFLNALLAAHIEIEQMRTVREDIRVATQAIVETQHAGGRV